MKSREKKQTERLKRAASKAHEKMRIAQEQRSSAEALVWQQKLILDALSQQVPNATCGWAFAFGLLNPDAIAPEDPNEAVRKAVA